MVMGIIPTPVNDAKRRWPTPGGGHAELHGIRITDPETWTGTECRCLRPLTDDSDQRIVLRQHEAGPVGPALLVVAVCDAHGGGRFVVSLDSGPAACRPLARRGVDRSAAAPLCGVGLTRRLVVGVESRISH